MRSMRFSILLVALSTVLGFVPPAIAAAAPDQSATAALGLDLESATIPDLQQRMDHGRLTSIRLTAAYLHRIRVVDPKIHAVLDQLRR